MPIARLLFALLVLAMAIGQLLSFSVFVEAIAGYRLTGETLSRILSVTLVAGELFAGIGLLTGGPRFRHLAGSVGFGVAVTWSALAAQAFLRGLDVANCGCFGRYFAQRLSWFVLLQDAYFLILAYLAMRSAFRDRVVGPRTEQPVGPDRGGG
ncbi:MAG: MauE/DoxX family redox-associated membrane protein [Actinomycetota bacterium]